jgi:endonuclease III
MNTSGKVLKILGDKYTESGAVDLGNPRDTLIATLLSARTRDDTVLKVYPNFKKTFPTWKKLADADQEDIEQSIKSINFFRNKSRALKKLAQKIITDFKSKVPGTMEELITLPGVGRKTASCVLSYEFKEPAIAVDTHVFRIAHRLGWSASSNRDNVENDLKKVVTKTKWNIINRTFVPFGRETCKPSKPQCYKCPIEKYCKFQEKNLD